MQKIIKTMYYMDHFYVGLLWVSEEGTADTRIGSDWI